MKIRNLTAKPIGFGSVVILPDQTGDTPNGYDRGHPTVEYYLSRGWIKEVGTIGGAAAVNSGGLSVNVSAGIPGTGGENSNLDNDPGAGDDNNMDGGNNDPGAGNSTSGENTGGSTSGNKNLDRMTKDELQAVAFERGVEFTEADTRQVLIDKIKAVKNANE